MSTEEKIGILIVDDDPGMRLGMAETLRRHRHFAIDQASQGSEALQLLRERTYQVMVTDMRMPGMTGLELLREAKKLQPALEVLLVTAYGTIDTAVEAIKCGAYDYILKPFSAKDFEAIVHGAVVKEKPQHLKTQVHGRTEMVTRSSQLIRVLEIAKRAAKSNATILIQAESGTGKELLAKTIWEHSQRSQAPLVAVNCAALPDNLLESELFGFEKGSFTGAMHSKPGKFELADGGTLILDEIGEMPLHLQAKILRVLQEQEVDRIGGKSPLSVDVRVIAITNQNLKQQIQEGKFREDLFFRLNVIPLTIPALRHRPEDVAPLVAHFLQRYQGPNTLDPEAERFVRTYHWPGNVRELENMIQRASVLALGDEVRLQDLVLSDQVTHQPSVTLEGPRSGSESMLEDPFRLRAGLTVQEMERKLIEVTLAETNGNRTRAAEFLGISLRTLRNKLNEYKSSNS